MEASIEAMEVDPPTTLPDAPETGSRAARLVVPVLLAAGWGALIAFSATFLMDEARLDTARAAAQLSPVVEPAGFDRVADPARSVSVSEPAVDRLDAVPRESTPSQGKDAPRVGTVAAASAEEMSSAAPVPNPTASPAPRADFVGTWGTHLAACGARPRRRGYMPATITEESAKAGKTLCRFRNGRRDGSAWTMAADCSERGRTWTSLVRLVVDGDRLTWSSAKGRSSYIRCGRREG